MQHVRRCVLIVCLVLLGSAVSAADQVTDFVTRFYTVILNRSPDQGGLDNWVNALNDGSQSGADVGRGFVLSTEYKNRNRTDSEFVTDLYSAFFNRAPDSGGFTSWTNELAGGTLREDVLWGFIMANEFQVLSNSYGIQQTLSSTTQLYNVRQFVRRFYQQCLNREPDEGGIDAWVNALLSGSQGGGDVAMGFVWSQEFLNRNTTLNDYLTIHYQAFFNRAPDSGGLTSWTNGYTDGSVSRREITSGFTGSQEFITLASGYGITAASTASGATHTVTGIITDGGTATASNEIQFYKGSTLLYDVRLTNSSGTFTFTTASNETIDQYEVAVQPAP